MSGRLRLFRRYFRLSAVVTTGGAMPPAARRLSRKMAQRIARRVPRQSSHLPLRQSADRQRRRLLERVVGAACRSRRV